MNNYEKKNINIPLGEPTHIITSNGTTTSADIGYTPIQETVKKAFPREITDGRADVLTRDFDGLGHTKTSRLKEILGLDDDSIIQLFHDLINNKEAEGPLFNANSYTINFNDDLILLGAEPSIHVNETVKEEYIHKFMETLAGSPNVFNETLKTIFTRILARQLTHTPSSNEIVESGTFIILVQVFTFISTNINDRPDHSPTSYPESLMAAARDNARFAVNQVFDNESNNVIMLSFLDIVRPGNGLLEVADMTGEYKTLHIDKDYIIQLNDGKIEGPLFKANDHPIRLNDGFTIMGANTSTHEKETVKVEYIHKFMETLAGGDNNLMDHHKSIYTRILGPYLTYNPDSNEMVEVEVFNTYIQVFTFNSTKINNRPAHDPNAYPESLMASARNNAILAVNQVSDNKISNEIWISLLDLVSAGDGLLDVTNISGVKTLSIDEDRIREIIQEELNS